MSEKRLEWRSTLKAVVDERRRDLGPHPGLDEIVAYHAGELEAEGAKRLQDHLVLCPECARLLLELDAFAADAAATAEPPTAAVVPIAKYRAARQWRWAAAAGLAAAAVLVLLVAWPRDEPLPGYDLDLSGGARSVRAPEADPEGEASVFVAGSRLALKLQPETAVAGPVTARAYLRRGDELRALSASTLEVRGDGVVALEGTVGTDLLLPEGESELVMAVARPAALPSRSRLKGELARDETPRGKRWVGFKQEIRVLEPNAGAPAAGAPAADEEGPWVEYAGCRTIVIGPICILEGDRRLTLWVRHHRVEEIRIEAGGSRRSYPATAVQDGHRYEIEVGKWTTDVVVEVHREEKRSIWALEVRHAPIPDWLVQARELYESGEWDEARRLLEPRLAGPEGVDVGGAASLLARIERRSGDAEKGDGYYRSALTAHREAGRLFDEVEDATGLAWHLIQEKRFSEARELLDSLPVHATGGSAAVRYLAAYARGLLAEETGDLRAAMSWMTRAAREAERAGMSREQIFAEDLLARQLSTVGRADAAAALHSRVRSEMTHLCPGESEAPVLDACECANLLNNRAWARWLSLEAGGPADDPSPLFEEVERILMEELARGGTCVLSEDLPNVRLNLALAALRAGDAMAADRYLALAAVDPAELPRLALWQLDVEARISLAGSEPGRALDLYEKLGRQAETSSSPEAAWRAAFGRAMALRSLGRTGDALGACAEAERVLDRESLLVPMHEGREMFIAQRERASRFCLDLLLRAGREDEALAVARRSAARALRTLRLSARIADLDEEQRRLWEQAVASYKETRVEIEGLVEEVRKGLPRDEEERLERETEARRQALRRQLDRLFELIGGSSALAGRDLAPPAPRTLLLAYHPLPRGWAAIAADREGVTARRVEPAGELPLEARSEEELASLLLQPFAERIRRAAEVHVIPYGGLRDVDFHALPLAGDVLLRHAPVVYRLDLPDLAAETWPPSPLALVVSAPGVLEASAEAGKVRLELESPPDAWRVELLEGEGASESELRRRLPDAALFHYAGHADFDADSRGWDSHLALAGGGRLTVDDILASPRVPRWVVLSGCETGLDSRAAPLASIGLAQAFLVAGAESVVAATAEVSDAGAAALAAALYRHWDAETPLAAALREAQLERRDQDPESDWQKFRAIAR